MTDETQRFRHRYVPGSSGHDRTLLLLHGTGGDENDLIALGQILEPDAALLSPRGQVLERGMPRFFRRFAEGVFDIEDLRYRTNELADFIDAASKKYGFSTSTLFIAGYSNGANIGASLLLLRPGSAAGAALFHPVVPLVPDTLPDLTGIPVFIGAGRNDPYASPDQTTELAQLLRQGGADVQTFWHDAGHALTGDEVREAQAWLSRLPNPGRVP